ncbi:hypothetical protein T492DRAFT_838299 [Pavlovales sp. CCMP2436]|nr:hypothetical protein T492DRAFT_838299 [Pavlovales sp. CCMP2436]
MTAGLGEGANTALESAALLADGVAESLQAWREAGSKPSKLDAALSAAFWAFGVPESPQPTSCRRARRLRRGRGRRHNQCILILRHWRFQMFNEIPMGNEMD